MNFNDDLSLNEIVLVLNSSIEKVDVISSSIEANIVDSIQEKLNASLIDSDSESSPHLHANTTRPGIAESRNRLVSWLEKNRLPVKLDKNSSDENHPIINILDSVYIYPPYEIKNAISKNEIILNRIRSLMSDCSL